MAVFALARILPIPPSDDEGGERDGYGLERDNKCGYAGVGR